MRTITLEEHFATPDYLAGPGRKLKERAERTGGRLANLVADLVDIGEGRVGAMDAAGIDMQALSLTSPGVEQLSGRRGESFRPRDQCGDRGGGPAPTGPVLRTGVAAAPRSAGRDRRARTDDCGGWRARESSINGHVGGRYLDDPDVLAGARARRDTDAADLSPPDAISARSHRRLVWRPEARGERDDGRLRLGMAHRDGAPCFAHGSRRRVRRASRACRS